MRSPTGECAVGVVFAGWLLFIFAILKDLRDVINKKPEAFISGELHGDEVVGPQVV